MSNGTKQAMSAESSVASPGRKRWLYICPPLFLFWAVANVDKIGISVIASNAEFLQDLGLVGKAAEVGWLMTAFTLVYGLSSMFWGQAVDKFGPRRAALIGVTIWAVSLVIGAISNTFGHVLLSRLLLGLGEGVIFPATNKYINNWFHTREFGKAQASWVYGQYIGPVIGLPALVWLIMSFDWHTAFYALAAVAIVINLPTLYFMTRDTPEQHPGVDEAEVRYIEQGKASQVKKTVNEKFYKDFRYWMVCVAFVVVAALFYGITFWMPTYLEKAQGMSIGGIKAALSLSWVFAVIAVFAISILADRTKRPALIGMLVYLICGVALLMVPVQTNPTLVAALLAVGLGCTASQLLLTQLVLVKLAVPKSTGKAAGIIGLLNITGGFVTTWMGYVVDSTGGNYNAAFFMLALFPFVGAVAYALMLRGEQRDLRPDASGLVRA